MSRVRARIEGTVQGVGFRPYVYRLADEMGLAGHVLNDSRGVVVEVEAPSETVERFLARLPAEAPPLATVERVTAEQLEELGELGFSIRDSPAGRRAARGGHARQRHLRRLPGRAVRPGRPPLPLPVHELHQLRPAVHDRARRPVRPAEHDDGRLRDVPGLPRRVRGPGRPALPRPAERLPGLRAARAARLRRRRARSRTRGSADPVEAAARALRDGAIVAIKGLGGFHLACLAERRGRRRRAARAQAPRGQAVRADGRRRRGGARPGGDERGRRGAAAVARAADRAGAEARERAAWRRRWRPARRSSA